MASKILFCPTQPKVIMDLVHKLTPPGFELVPADLDTPQFYEAAADAEYYLGFARRMGNDFFRAAPKLKLVQLTSAGYDQVDPEAAKKAKVPVSNNGGANAIAVAEHTMALMLAVLKKIVWHHNNVVAGKWRVGNFAEPKIYEVATKTLGIIGLGNIGKKVARRAQAFGMRVIYYDIVRLTEDQEDALGVRFTLFTELLRTSDIVTVHAPETPETRHLIGPRELALMPDGAVLINTAGPASPNDIADAIADQVLGKADEPRAATFAGDLGSLTGTYRGPARGRELEVSVTVDAGVLTARRGDNPARPLAYLEGMTFAAGQSRFYFVRAGAEVNELRVDDVGGFFVLRKAK